MKKSGPIPILFFLTLAVCANVVFADVKEDKIRQLETQIDQYNQEIAKKESEAQSLANQISIFDLQIKQIQAEIDATNLTISNLNSAIKQKEADIKQKEKEIKSQNALLAEYLRQISQNDAGSFLEFLLKNKKFSDFYDDLNNLSNIQKQIQETLANIKNLKDKLTSEKEDLESDKAEQQQLKLVQNRQKNQLNNSKKEKQKLLDQTKGQEKIYQQLISKAREDIEKIRNQSYDLALGYKMTFGEALSHALPAAQKTGVRRRFLWRF